MPWVPSYSRDEAAEAIAAASTWSEALSLLGISPVGKSFGVLRKWAAIWEIPAPHLPPYRPRRSSPRFSEAEARRAIADSLSWAEALRKLGYAPSGANPQTLRKWAERWGIATNHFDPYAGSRQARMRDRGRLSLEQILVENSSYSRSNLKARLYDAGLKQPVCELCEQGEEWNGRRISMVLDHINGVRDDNRIENLQIVYPNCAAGLDTHCGRNSQLIPNEAECLRCGQSFRPKGRSQRYCSRECGSRWDRGVASRPGIRKVDRPAYEELLFDVKELGYSAVARRYGVSDNAIRKWIRQYERERAALEGRDPGVIEIPTRTWPNRRDKKDAA